MKKTLYIFALLILLVVAFVAGNRFNQRGAGQGAADGGERRILYYVDPMDPAHITQEPGIAPCGMPMEPVYADDAPGGPDAGGSALSASPGAVRINQQKQQIIGVQVGEVARSAHTAVLRALGRIAADENRIYTLTAATDGWVGEVHAGTTGSLVSENQLLAHIKVLDYDFFTWQRTYISEQGNEGRRRALASARGGDGRTDGMQPEEGPAGASDPATGTPMAPLPSTGTPHEPDAGRNPPGDTPAMESPQPHDHTGNMPSSAPPAATPAAPDTLVDPPQQSGQAPVLLKKRATLPEAARPRPAGMVTKDGGGRGGLPDTEDSFTASRARLELLKRGVGESQLAELARSRAYLTSAELRSPVHGLVLSRNISPRQKIDRGTECFRIADLGRVWVEADLYGGEADNIRPGMAARVFLPNRKESSTATVSEILPRFDAATRTLKVRLEMDNPGLVFRPDMFVDVEFHMPLPQAISIPADAVIDSGKRTIVYAVVEEGVFEPREVVTGWRWGDRVEIVDGLKPGEKIVVSGNFLIDSESRMKLAAAGLMEKKTVNAAGDQAPPSAVPSQPEPQSPAMEIKASVATVKDPVCGMTVDPDKARVAGLFTEARGQTYYFCSEECREEFHKHGPQPAVSAQADLSPAPSKNGGQAANHGNVVPADTSSKQEPQHSPVNQTPADAPGAGGPDHD